MNNAYHMLVLFLDSWCYHFWWKKIVYINLSLKVKTPIVTIYNCLIIVFNALSGWDPDHDKTTNQPQLLSCSELKSTAQDRTKWQYHRQNLPTQARNWRRRILWACIYVRVRSGRGCCWWVWVCERTRTVSSSELHWLVSPGGCTVGRACEALPCRWRPTRSCGICSGSRPAERHPSVECTWREDQVLPAIPWTTGTYAYNN